MSNFLPVFCGDDPWYRANSYKADGQYPSIILDFEHNRYVYNGSTRPLSDIFDYSRASTAYYFGADGTLQTAAINQLRLAYDPETGASLGAYIEEAKTNSIAYSNTPYTSWSNNGTTKTAGTSALGFTDAAVAASGGQTWHRINTSTVGVLTAGNNYSFYSIVKAGTSGRVRITMRDNAGAVESTINGVVGSALTTLTSLAGAITYGGSIPLGGGIYLIYGLFVPGGTYASGAATMGVGPDSATTGEDIVVYYNQLENGIYPSSPIITAGSSVTRSADVMVSTSATAIPFANWFSATAGSARINSVMWFSDTTSHRLSLFRNASGSEEIALTRNAANNQIFRTVASVIEYSPADPYVFATKGSFKSGFMWADNDFNACSDGTSPTNDGTAPIPTGLDRGAVGTWSGVSPQPNCFFKEWVYYPFRVTDSEMQRITT